MSVRRPGCWLILAGLAAAFWLYEGRPSASQMIGTLVRPLTQSRSAVREAEHKRVVARASSEVERPLRSIRIGMSEKEVRRLLGDPANVQSFREGETPRVRWRYPAIRRVLVFEAGRLISISIS